ncbi:MAG: diaminopimelate epimerase [Marinosulfonomonas sp.]|nr:MAG: diaminopimelate epimerase [Marinosulfonomonas sp.]
MQENRHIQNLAFMKMHGLGNDFVVIDSRGRDSVVTSALAQALGDRHRGIGFDQLAEIRSGSDSDIALTFWNADGSTAAACGNATRCVAQHVMAELGKQSLSIRTPRGVLETVLNGDGLVSVNMGQPQFEWDEIPLARQTDTRHLEINGDPIAVGMGNPHCVLFVDEVEAVDIAAQGSELEHHPLFPQATNVEFAEIRSRSEIRMRVWERGTGITLACGSGACATAVAAHIRGLTDRVVRMELDGGWMSLDWRDDGVWMTGPTAHVFDATLTPAFLDNL